MRYEDFDSPNTSILVAGFHRGAKIPVLVGAVIVAVVLGAMFFTVGGRGATLRNNTLVASGRAPVDPRPANFAPVNSPVYGLSTVEVVLNNDGELMVDGKRLRNGRFHDLQLAAGDHTMVAHLGDKILTEKFRTGADESLRFEFQKSRVRVFREVAVSP